MGPNASLPPCFCYESHRNRKGAQHTAVSLQAEHAFTLMSPALNHYHMHRGSLFLRTARQSTCGLSLTSRSNADKPGFLHLSAVHLLHYSLPARTGTGSESLTPNPVGKALLTEAWLALLCPLDPFSK